MLTTSRTCWMSLLSLYFLRSLLANLERVLPQLGIDTDLAAWGNILNPRFQVNLQFKKKDCKLFFVQRILLGIYNDTVERLEAFLKYIYLVLVAVPFQTNLETEEVSARHDDEVVVTESPAERLLKEKIMHSEEVITFSEEFQHEMAVYSKLRKPHSNESVLKFWSENKRRLPLLSKAAKANAWRSMFQFLS